MAGVYPLSASAVFWSRVYNLIVNLIEGYFSAIVHEVFSLKGMSIVIIIIGFYIIEYLPRGVPYVL